ncbi:MAG: type II CAAX prenyl endopeptidase Rce1 family protein [Streptococcus sp.]
MIFGILYYRSKTLLSPILAHILLNLYYTLPLLLSVFK